MSTTIIKTDCVPLDDEMPEGSRILHMSAGQALCDHNVDLLADAEGGCPFCIVADAVRAYRPRHHNPRIGPEVLGCCDDCGIEVALTGHLYKTPAGYLCEACIQPIDDCAKF